MFASYYHVNLPEGPIIFCGTRSQSEERPGFTVLTSPDGRKMYEVQDTDISRCTRAEVDKIILASGSPEVPTT